MTRVSAAIAILAIFGAAGCAKPDSHPEPGRLKTYSGMYARAYEVSQFIPSEIAESWWLSGGPAPIYAMPVMTAPGFGDLRVMRLTVRGKVSELGLYGHGGLGQRELVVSEILEISPAPLEDFRRAECRLPIPEWVEKDVRKATTEECRKLGVDLASEMAG